MTYLPDYRHYIIERTPFHSPMYTHTYAQSLSLSLSSSFIFVELASPTTSFMSVGILEFLNPRLLRL
jgi:hypothetical protein